MDQVEEQPQGPAAEDPGPHHPKDEGGTGVVAEGQQPLRLRLGALAALVEGDGRPGPHRIAPHKAQGQGGGAGPVHPEQGRHHRLKQPPQVSGHPQLHHQGGEDEEGEQGGDDHIAAQLQAVPHGPHGLPRPQHQGQRGAQQPQGQQKLPVLPLSHQPPHSAPSFRPCIKHVNQP